MITTTATEQQASILEMIKKFLPLIIVAASIIMWFATTDSRIDLIESQVDSLEKIDSQRNASLVEIQGSVIRIETTLEFIKERLNDQ